MVITTQELKESSSQQVWPGSPSHPVSVVTKELQRRAWLTISPECRLSISLPLTDLLWVGEEKADSRQWSSMPAAGLGEYAYVRRGTPDRNGRRASEQTTSLYCVIAHGGIAPELTVG